MNPIGINLLVYKKALDRGESQSSLLADIAALGADIAEIRREYLKAGEAAVIGEKARALGLEIYYSVPEKLAVNGGLNPSFALYLAEGRQMGATHIKLNIGELPDLSPAAENVLAGAIKKAGMCVTIENDQTAENGNLPVVLVAVERGQALGIGYTMDIGNWCWQQESPEKAFALLGKATTVFHLKDIAFGQEGPHTVYLDRGVIPWRAMVSQLEEGVPIMLEYPMDTEKTDSELRALREACGLKKE